VEERTLSAPDLKEFAYQALEIAKENLSRDKELLPVAFLVVDEELLVHPVYFSDEESKNEAYEQVVAAAKEYGASAIITLNDARYAPPDDPDTHEWGYLERQGAPECIMISVSGPAMENWTLLLPYKREKGEIVFEQPQELPGGTVGMLPGWASNEPPTVQ
jgi:hypothetical protein